MNDPIVGDLKDLLGRVADPEGMYRHEPGRRKRIMRLVSGLLDATYRPAVLTIRRMRAGWKINGRIHPHPPLGVTVACKALIAYRRGASLNMRRYGCPKSIHKAVRHDAVRWARRERHPALETALLNFHKRGDFLHFRPPAVGTLIVNAK